MLDKTFRLRSILALLLVTLLFWTSVPARQEMSNLFSEQKLRERIKYLSSDETEGRGPGTNGGKLAAQYIADQLKAMGVKGAMPDGSYFQNVKLYAVKTDPATVLTIAGKDKSETFKFADEYVAFTGAQKADVNIDADIVFVGYGIDSPKYRWNDYKGSPADYKGKVLLVMVNDPPATKEEPDLFGGRALTYNGRWTYKFEEAARRGAVGAILIHTTESAGYPWSVVRTSNGNWRYDIARNAGDKTPFLQMRSWITNDSAKRLVQLAGKDLDQLRESAKTRAFKPVNLGLRAKINIKSDTKVVDSPNVIGILPGSDAKLKDEYVIYTAHWDHLGIGEPDKTGDKIYNGAVDNASGNACILGIAEALVQLPQDKRPKRSSVFLFTTAEEQGLLGAEYYSKNPIFPIAKTSANVNIDSANIYGKTLDFNPMGAERSTLNAIVDVVAKERGLTISPDARPEQGSFYRSDHFPFAKVGVPSISLHPGEKFVNQPADYGEKMFQEYNSKHYHQPSDEYSDSWNMEGMIQEAEIALAIGMMAGNAKALQKFNPTDEFASAQKGR